LLARGIKITYPLKEVIVVLALCAINICLHFVFGRRMCLQVGVNDENKKQEQLFQAGFAHLKLVPVFKKSIIEQ